MTQTLDQWLARNDALVRLWVATALRVATDSEFKEQEHPRDEDGQFTSAELTSSPKNTTANRQKYAALLGKKSGDHFEAAKQYYRENLQGKYIKGMISGKPVDVHFTGGSWRELKRSMKNDALKAELVTCLPDVISGGEYISNPLHKHHGGVKQFHTFRKDVETSKGKKEVFVDVAEMPASKHRHSVYNMTHEDMTAHQTKKAALGIKSKTASDKLPGGNIYSGSSPSAARIACDKNISQSFEVVNIRIADSVGW